MGRMFSLNTATIYALCLGQLISLLIAGTGVTSTVLADANINIPTAQSSINYVLLCSYLVYRLYKLGFNVVKNTSVAWWRYALLALTDVEANYLVVKAYQYTSITSIMLIDCWTIPCVMLLSFWLFNTRYSRRHLIGVVLCLLGLGVLVASDYLVEAAESNGQNGHNNTTMVMNQPSLMHELMDDESDGTSNVIIGDVLTFAAATLYAMSNVGQEYLVKNFDRLEYLSLLGFFGVIFNTIQLLALERTQFAAVEWTSSAAVAFVGFALCMFCMYSLTSKFLQKCDATLFNLSLLTSDAWAILASVAIFHQPLHPLYFVSLAVTVFGLYLYNTAKSPSSQTTPEDAEEQPVLQDFSGVASPDLSQTVASTLMEYESTKQTNT